MFIFNSEFSNYNDYYIIVYQYIMPGIMLYSIPIDIWPDSIYMDQNNLVIKVGLMFCTGRCIRISELNAKIWSF